MRIIEQKILGKCPDQALCEDGLFVGEHFIAVVDGVTSKKALSAGSPTGGVLARRAILKLLSELDPAVDCYTAIDAITACLAEVDAQNEDTPRAVMVLYSVHRHEIWSVGDCGCLINGALHTNEKAIDGVLSACRSAIIEMMLAYGATEAELFAEDRAREMLLPVLAMQQRLENKGGRYGYPVLNGTPVRREQIKILTVAEGDEVVLASDGYPLLCSTLAESEAALEQVKKDDPLCYKNYVSTKGFRTDGGSFDDRTYIRFVV